jgi:hypothetical protein
VAATTRLACAALTLLAISAVAGASAQARSAGRTNSILAALEATDTALLGQVLEVESEGTSERASVRVLETLRGARVPERTQVRAGAEALLEGAGAFASGETVLLLIARRGDGFELPAGLRQGKVTLETAAEQAEARALLRGYLAAVSGSGDPAALDALLRRSVTLASPRLRAGVLEDLAQRLGAGDAQFLLGLAQDRQAPQDVRLFAIQGLGALSVPPPAALAALLEPAEPVAIRQAVVNAYASHGALDVLALGLADPDEAVRKTSVENLADPAAVAVLESHFDREPSPTVRIAIVKQLGLTRTEASRSALRRILASTPDAAIHRAGDSWLAAEP